MKTFLSLVLLCLGLSFANVRAAAQTIHVPADQPTIQAAINAAPAGATVLVAPGTYYENIDFKGKAITVTSSAGAAATILDGSLGHDAAVSFVTEETRASVLSGFTIQNGGSETVTATSGSSVNGGIYLVNSQPTISNNILTHNYCHTIYSNGSSPLILNNEIDNTVDTTGNCSFAGGAAIWLSGSLSSYNTGPSSTGGNPAIVSGNTIQNNTASGKEDAGGNGGVGVAVWGAQALIEGNMIRNNTTLGEGAIYAFNTNDVQVIGNLIYGNTAQYTSAGIDLEPPEQTVGPFVGIVAGNTVYNNTLAQQTGSISGPGTQIALSGNLAQYILINNLFAGNSTSPTLNCGTIYSYLSLTPLVFDHNDIFNSVGPAYSGSCPDQTGTYGNLSVDPRFVSPTTGDFHLQPGSPALDAGNNSAPALPATDLSGNPRVQDSTGLGHPVVDLGAYEAAGLTTVAPTILTLTPSTYTPYQAFFGNPGPFTLTAKVTSAAGIPPGPVTFYEDLNPISTLALDATGTAILTPTNITPGTHAFIATYPGQGTFPATVSAKFYVLFPKQSPTLQLTASPNPALLGTSVTITLKVSAPDGTIPSPVTLTDSVGTTLLATLTPDATGTATFTTSTLALGYHQLEAAFAGSATLASNAVLTGETIINGYATTTNLTSSLNPSGYQQPVTFTAQVTAATAGTPTGTITFLDGSSPLGSSPLNASATASITLSTLTAAPASAPHLITAQYIPTTSFAGSSATLRQVVNGLPTATILTVTPLTGLSSDTYTFTASVSTPPTSASSPTGTVTFSFGGATQTATLTNGQATISVSGLTPGQNTVLATYSGDTTFAPSASKPVTLLITAAPTALTLTSTANPAAALTLTTFTARLTVAGQPAPAGLPITFNVSGGVIPRSTIANTNAAGLATYTLTDLLPATYTVTASFFGNLADQPAAPALLIQLVTPNPTTTTLQATPNPAYQNQPLTLQVNVASPNGNPTGSVTFFEGTALIGSAPLTSAASATFNTNTLAPGTHLITAAYNPASSAFLASQSSAVSVLINPQDFLVSTPNPTLTIQTEHHHTLPFTITSIGSFSGPIALSCAAPLPAWVTCQLPPSTSLSPNQSAPITLSLDTDAVLGFKSSLELPKIILWATLLPLTLLAATRKRRLPRLFYLIAASLLSTLALTGCSGKYPASTPPGTYTITIVASGTSSGMTASTTHTLPITLIVTP